MNAAAKIHLSKLEKELVQNKDWILTKQSIIEKVYQLFGELLSVYKEISANEEEFLPDFFKSANGKISKGENYKGLPYVILDYPGFFSKEDVFAIRTMFWWGNFFSISLHISGKYFEKKKHFFSMLKYLNEREYFICISENEWQHHFDSLNYVPVIELEDRVITEIMTKNFFKISKKTDLKNWDGAPAFLEKSFIEILDFIKISYPNDGIVL
jgi:hypothetical protein